MNRVGSVVTRRRALMLSAVLTGVALVGLVVNPIRSEALIGVHSLSINDVAVTEGTGGPNNATFTVTLSGTPSSLTPISVDYTTVNDTATAGSDYTATAGTLTFAVGETTKSIVVPIITDSLAEPNETFTVTLSNSPDATIADGSGQGTINNDDQATLSINDVSVGEGNASTANATFVVSLNVARPETITVAYTTVPGTAKAPSDYTTTSGTLTFAPNDLTKTIPVPIIGDVFAEPNENYTVVLSSPTNATLADDTGLGTIVNDDGASPTLTVGDVTVTEGDAGTVNANFVVTRTNAPATTNQVISVDYATGNGSATSTSGDFAAASGTLNFDPTDLTKVVTVLVTGDTKNELDETFSLNLTNANNAVVTDAQGVGTILNDDPVPTLSIGDKTANEGSGGGTTSFTFPVTLSAASGKTVTVDFATANGTALTSNGDYTANTGTLTFTEGDLTKDITVLVAADNVNEADETFTVNLSNPSNATLADAQGLGTITNDDLLPLLTISDATVVEGNAGDTPATFTVTLTPASGQTVTVPYTTANNEALSPGDYTATSGSLVFTAGQTTKTITVQVKGDTLDEINETYFVNLGTPINATVTDGQGVGSITDDDGPPALSIGDSTVSEAGGTATFTVTLAPVSGGAVTVDYATANGTATAGADYTTTTGSLTFAAGESTKQITVPILQDGASEASETYTVTLTNPAGATIADAVGNGTITDDDPVPTLSIDDVTTIEGHTGTTNAAFTITLSQASTQTVTVAFGTTNGTATAGSDYTATSGTATFNPGELTKPVNVPILGDTNPEFNETYFVNLTLPTNATIADAQGAGAITNDDGPPADIAISNATITEGNTGTADATFTVTLAAPSLTPVTVDFTTADGSATQPSDYTTTTGTLTFAPSEVSKVILVPVVGDTKHEATTETFVVNLTNPSTNAGISDAQGTGTITDNDAAPTLSVNDATVTEGNTGTVNAVFTVTLSAASGLPATVHYATADGTATAGTDYTSTSGDLTFAPNELTKTVNVPVIGETVDESTESFVLNLTAPTGATTSDAQGAGTITDDDDPVVAVPTLAVNDVTVTEGNSGTVNAVFTVTKTGTTTNPTTVHYATADGTATQPSDYAPSSGGLTFAAADTTKTFTVVVNGDTAVEPTEAFAVALTAPTGATISDGAGTGTITNDDVVAGPQITTGAGPGGAPHVRTFSGSFAAAPTDAGGFYAYEQSFAGGVRVARGDFDLDGKDEIVTASGPNHAPEVKVWSSTGALLTTFNAYAASFPGGVYVAVGDVTGDNRPEIITGAGAGGAPHLRVFDGAGVALAGWYAYAQSFTGGVTVGAGDVNGGKAKIITGTGGGGAPHVQMFDGGGAVLASFYAYDPGFTGGVFVAAGDGRIVTGPGAGGGPHVKTFNASGVTTASFSAYGLSFTGGVRVDIGNLDGAAGAEILTGTGPGGGPHVRTFGLDGTPIGAGFYAYGASFSGGVFVAAGTA